MPFPKRLPLHLLVSFTMVASLLVLSLILVMVSYQNTKSTLLEATEDAAGNAGLLLDGHLNQLVQPVQAAIRQLQYDPLVNAASLDARMARVPVLAQTLASNPLLSAVYAGYENGDFMLLRHLRSDRAQQVVGAPEGAAYLVQSVERRNDEVIGQWVFLDADLRALQVSPRPDYLFDPRTRPWFERAHQSGDTILTPPYLFFTTAEIGVTLAIKADNGTILGMDASVADLSTQILNLSFTQGTRLALIDGDQQVVGFPDLSRMIVREGDSLRLITLSELGLPVLNNLAERNIPANRLTAFERSGRRWYGVWAPLSTFTGGDLRMLLAIPADELLGGAWSLLVRQLGWSALVILVALPVGWLIGRRIGLPLRQLTHQVAALGRFEFDSPIYLRSRIREVHELGAQTARMATMINSFKDLSHNLNRATDLDRLLEQVLTGMMDATGALSGAVYLHDQELPGLRLAEQKGHANDLATVLNPESPGDEDQLSAVRQTVQQPQQIVMATLLRNREERVIGVLALNMSERKTPNDEGFHRFIERLSGSVALAIETRQLVQDQKALIEGIIKVLAGAIDTKSPYTGGHCDRVPQLATILLNRVEAATEGPFASFKLNEAERYEFAIAAWLHDCGKVVTPEYIVDKATKLEALYNRIHEIRMRFEVLWRDADIDYWRGCERGEPEPELARKRDAAQHQLLLDYAFLAEMNIGGEALSDEDVERMQRIGDRTWMRHFSDRLGLSRAETRQLADYPEPSLPHREKLLDDKPEHCIPWEDYVPPVEKDHPENRWGFDMQLPAYSSHRGERYNLSVRRGTLTNEERFQINNHIVETLKMLTTLPWPDHLKRVPDIAANHHERMDGNGYPRRLKGEDMSISERVMAIADVFEALTAADRPYKPPKTLSESLRIMVAMGRDRHLDIDLLKLFIESGAYRVYAQGFLKPEQMDDVDEGALVADLKR